MQIACVLFPNFTQLDLTGPYEVFHRLPHTVVHLVAASDGNFLGRPLMVTENYYRTRLWNGDVGLVCADPEQGRTTCFLDAEGRLRRLGLGRLPPHESAFALSVHKSQGSEVDEIALILPREPSRILSRELLYTGITRARKRVVIFGSREILRTAVEQVVSRSTGLREQLAAHADLTRR